MFRLNKLVIGYQEVKISSIFKTWYKSDVGGHDAFRYC